MNLWLTLLKQKISWWSVINNKHVLHYIVIISVYEHVNVLGGILYWNYYIIGSASFLCDLLSVVRLVGWSVCWSVSYTRTWSVLISPSPIIRPWTDTQIRWRYSPKMDYLGCLSFPLVSLHAKATQAITEKWASNKNDFRPNRLIVNNQIGLPKNIKNERKLPQTLTMITNLIFYICFNVLCFYRYVELKIFQHFYKVRNNIFFSPSSPSSCSQYFKCHKFKYIYEPRYFIHFHVWLIFREKSIISINLTRLVQTRALVFYVPLFFESYTILSAYFKEPFLQ